MHYLLLKEQIFSDKYENIHSKNVKNCFLKEKSLETKHMQICK